MYNFAIKLNIILKKLKFLMIFIFKLNNYFILYLIKKNLLF